MHKISLLEIKKQTLRHTGVTVSFRDLKKTGILKYDFQQLIFLKIPLQDWLFWDWGQMSEEIGFVK